MQDVKAKPSGPVVAAFVAAGIASTVLGIFVVLNEVSTEISDFLEFDANFGIGQGVGPLSGKVILAMITFAVSWVVLHLALRGKEVNFTRWLGVALVFVLIGFALTFPPVFEFIVGLFSSEA